MQAPEKRVVVGKITTVHGVRGWVKIHSFAEPESNIFKYSPWWVTMPSGVCQLQIDQHRSVDKGFLAHIVDVDDREQAMLYCQREISVSPDLFAATDPGEYYWHQLEGLRVISRYQGQETDLGCITGFLETGANDVMIVKGPESGLKGAERLIPYLSDVIDRVDLVEGAIYVLWDPDFDSK